MRLLVRQKSETSSRNSHLQAESNFDKADRKDNAHGLRFRYKTDIRTQEQIEE
jgi:hypothetical protein